LANTKSAIKRVRSSGKRRLRTRRVRTEARTYIKSARAQIEAGELEAAQKSVAQAVRVLDKAAERGIIHKNNAARRKSRLLRTLNQATQTKET
jgi:small subunit ribosomal protein S20